MLAVSQAVEWGLRMKDVWVNGGCLMEVALMRDE